MKYYLLVGLEDLSVPEDVDPVVRFHEPDKLLDEIGLVVEQVDDARYRVRVHDPNRTQRVNIVSTLTWNMVA